MNQLERRRLHLVELIYTADYRHRVGKDLTLRQVRELAEACAAVEALLCGDEPSG